MASAVEAGPVKERRDIGDTKNKTSRKNKKQPRDPGVVPAVLAGEAAQSKTAYPAASALQQFFRFRYIHQENLMPTSHPIALGVVSERLHIFSARPTLRQGLFEGVNYTSAQTET